MDEFKVWFKNTLHEVKMNQYNEGYRNALLDVLNMIDNDQPVSKQDFIDGLKKRLLQIRREE